jgi:hypothetical protein
MHASNRRIGEEDPTQCQLRVAGTLESVYRHDYQRTKLDLIAWPPYFSVILYLVETTPTVPVHSSCPGEFIFN